MNTIENGHEVTVHENLNLGWDKSRQNKVIAHLLEGGDLQEVMESLSGFSESFAHALDTIDCSDGRVLDGRKIGIAGSGLLLSSEERAKFIETYKGKIRELTTHRDCGAAGIAFKSLSVEDIPAGVSTADEYGTYLGQKMAEELGTTHRFLEMDEMANSYHNEVGIVVDQTGRFDSTNLADFPAHFVCSGAGFGLSPEYMKSEIKTLAGIALGDHGFGKRFDSANPLYLIVAANNHSELLRWEEVAKEALADFGDRIAIKGFIRPDTAEKN